MGKFSDVYRDWYNRLAGFPQDSTEFQVVHRITHRDKRFQVFSDYTFPCREHCLLAGLLMRWWAKKLAEASLEVIDKSLAGKEVQDED